MKFYRSDILFAISNRGAFLRSPHIFERLKGYVKLLIACFSFKGIPIHLPYKRYIIWNNIRKDGDRFYGIGIINKSKVFIKINSPELNTNSEINEYPFIDFKYKYYYPKFSEWEKLCFDDKGNYHGDTNITNILCKGGDIIIIDWEKSTNFNIEYA